MKSATPALNAKQLSALLLVALNLRLALASIGPVLESLRADLHFSYGVAGLLTALPVICMGAFAPLAMPLSARLGLKQTIFAMLLLIGFATLLRAHATLPSLLISSAGVGIGIALLGPLVGAWIKQEFPQNSARISGWITTSLCLGAALAAGGSAALGEYLGWPAALSCWAVLAFVAAWKWRGVSSSTTAKKTASSAIPWRNARAWLLMLSFSVNSLVFYALLTWLAPAYLSYGFSSVAAGRLLGAFTLIQIAGTALVSALPAQQRDRRPALILSSACTLAGLVGVWHAPLAAPYLWMGLLGAGTAALFALTLILPLDYSDSPEAAGSWTAMMCAGGYLIAACGPYVCGLLRDVTGGYTLMFATLCGLSGFGLLLCAGLRPAADINH
ncbi:MAG: MFS transporter [Steroidobacteraceae bacterium]